MQQLGACPLYWVVQGCVMNDIWVIAHECGHHAFSDYLLLDNMGYRCHKACITRVDSLKGEACQPKVHRLLIIYSLLCYAVIQPFFLLLLPWLCFFLLVMHCSLASFFVFLMSVAFCVCCSPCVHIPWAVPLCADDGLAYNQIRVMELKIYWLVVSLSLAESIAYQIDR
ncbi:uncharacterized protein LOC125529462 [Triticum urartu]|uniref:uncharacterized protein LOC125527282 n=1 Tax=Triticum urartu TaxID=4572 RepID=UPI0020444A75|nr:uncharacterized protein LOC125527282 [Triticum urartu]XP_048549831.1 uncharacterized protein LOC125529462 [Triticum urartu]